MPGDNFPGERIESLVDELEQIGSTTCSARYSERVVSTILLPVVIGAASEMIASYGPSSTSFPLISLENASPVNEITVGGIGSSESGLRSTETIFPLPLMSSRCV